MKFQHIFIGFAIAILVIIVGFAMVTPGKATISINGTEFNVLVAESSMEKYRGLSGTDLDSLNADGMVFLYDDQEVRTFVMRDMNYDLDVLWVQDGKLVKVHQNVPAPVDGEEPQTMSSTPFEIDMVIELEAGTYKDRGLQIGMIVTVE